MDARIKSAHDDGDNFLVSSTPQIPFPFRRAVARRFCIFASLTRIEGGGARARYCTNGVKTTGAEVNHARLRMTRIPKGADLILKRCRGRARLLDPQCNRDGG